MAYRIAEIRERWAKATPGEWRREALGGCSTVLASVSPRRNDTRIPAYAYDERRGYCIAYPFLGDGPNDVRLDLVSFSHDDATAIASAPGDIAFLLSALAEAQKAAAAPEPDVERVAMQLAYIEVSTLRGLGMSLAEKMQNIRSYWAEELDDDARDTLMHEARAFLKLMESE